jgi:hypothetical protein
VVDMDMHTAVGTAIFFYMSMIRHTQTV